MKPCPPGHRLNATGNTDEHGCKCDDRDQNIKRCISKRILILQVIVAVTTLNLKYSIGRSMGTHFKQWFNGEHVGILSLSTGLLSV